MGVVRNTFFTVYLSLALLSLLAVTVLGTCFFIRSHEAAKRVDRAKTESQSIWEFVRDYCEAGRTYDLPIVPEVAGVHPDVYVVDSFNRPRTPARWAPFSRERADGRLLSPSIAAAVDGEYGMGIANNYIGEPSVVAYGPIQLDGIRQALLVELPLKEIRAGISPWWYQVPEVISILMLGVSFTVYLSISSLPRDPFTLVKDISGQDLAQLLTSRSMTTQKIKTIMRALDRTGMLLVIFHPDGTIHICSDPLMTLTGYPAEQLQGMNLKDLVIPRFREFLSNHLSEITCEDWRPVSIYIRLKTRSGESNRVLCNVHRMIFDGKVFGVATSVRSFRTHRESTQGVVSNGRVQHGGHLR